MTGVIPRCRTRTATFDGRCGHLLPMQGIVPVAHSRHRGALTCIQDHGLSSRIRPLPLSRLQVVGRHVAHFLTAHLGVSLEQQSEVGAG